MNPLVTTSALVRRYEAKTALAGVDLAVPAGAVYGLVGPNGSGKTTLLSIVAGLRRPTSGSVHVGVARREMAVLSDTPRFDPWLTGREVVDLARNLLDPSVPAEAVDSALERTGLADARDQRNGGYSRGMLQRLGLAAALVTGPQLLLLDEPASALDPAGRREVLDLVAGLSGSATVLFSSHILADVQQVCDTVGVLRAGQLLYQGPLDDLLSRGAVTAYEVRLRSPQPEVVEALRGAAWIRSVDERAPGALRLGVTSLADAEQYLPRLLGDAGARVVSLWPDLPDLERVFLELTA